MRIRKYLIGTIACLVGVFAFSSVASAAVTSLNTTINLTPAKQKKKVRGPAGVFFASDDTHAGFLPCPPGTANTDACRAYPPSVQAVITFTRDIKFTPGNLPDCNLSALSGKTTAGARAACPRSIVGTGSNRNLTTSGQTLNGVITAFNGAPSGGNPSLYLHVDIAGVTTKPILNGVIRGNTLTVQIPPVPGAVIEHFDTTIGKKVVGKKRNKQTGKVQKTFYLSAKCSRRNWTTTETVTYQNGQQLSDTVSSRCKQKK
ncbi:MAG TPA: hypothetical protein VFY33_02345 [Solirubrobacterales bacterium]|nr:hypothetical protein [Solirubrobacterales bacterium]